MVHGLGKWTCTPGGGDWRVGEYHYPTHILPLICPYLPQL